MESGYRHVKFCPLKRGVRLTISQSNVLDKEVYKLKEFPKDTRGYEALLYRTELPLVKWLLDASLCRYDAASPRKVILPRNTLSQRAAEGSVYLIFDVHRIILFNYALSTLYVLGFSPKW